MVQAALRWFRQHARDLPWRRTRDPYAIWVSEIMLQQTQVKTVIPYWERWRRALPTIRALARARPEQVLKLWEGLGYYLRARKLHEAAKRLVRECAGKFPTAFAEVLALPGIGRYTAGAICSIAYNQPVPVLDGNVTRVLLRVFGIGGDPTAGETRKRLWFLAERLVRSAADAPSRGRRNCSDLNQALMELGAVTCTPRNPRCPACPLKEHCAAFQHPARGTGELVFAADHAHAHRGAATKPALLRRPKPIARHVVAFVVERNCRFLVRQRPAQGVNGGLWEFPNAEVPLGSPGCQSALREVFGLKRAKAVRLLRLRHSITRYRITLDVYRPDVGARQIPGGTGSRWCSLAQLQRLPFPSAHRRIVEHLLAGGRPRRRGQSL